MEIVMIVISGDAGLASILTLFRLNNAKFVETLSRFQLNPRYKKRNKKLE